MKEDVIDLISDGEESCEESPGMTIADTNKGKLDDIWSKQGHGGGSSPVSHDKREELPCGQNCSDAPTFLQCPLPPKSVTSVQGTPITRQFWKAGDYEVKSASPNAVQNGMDHVRVHPKFLHSNATSHKWALGAIAELLDNSIDEVPNGATFVTVDKVTTAIDNSPALQVQDDGGGMDPDNMRHCMSLGYSRKMSNMTIGQYGNGFKTSTMRLGADVIVFSRCVRNRCITQSVGLLSYTFLRANGYEDIVVPMVDFEVIEGKPKMLIRSTKEDWEKNFSTVLQWSPYTTEAELFKQFDDLGQHGTKIIVYNLWMNDDGDLELDFDTDPEDIQVRGVSKPDKDDTLQKQLINSHIASRLRFSLRAYASILYLQMPPNFQLILRGKIVEHLCIADDLKFAERILYKPQMGYTKDLGYKEVSVITTIGFAKEAPYVSVHGFNVYHKNRLIMPFWKVFQENSSRGRGVVGVLEANFMEPAHDKQDFERTPILQRLETRLKQMTIEYWNLHCNLIGYQAPKQSNKNRSSTSQSPMLPADPSAGTIRLQQANGAVNLQVEARQSETSAPSTPPQPAGTDGASQVELLLDNNKDVDEKPSISGGKRSGSNLGKRPLDYADSTKTDLPPHQIGSSKRLKITATTADSFVEKQAVLRVGSGGSSAGLDKPVVNVDEVVEELDQLRARCKVYKSREKALKSRVTELEAELQEFKEKYKALAENCPELRKPKKECH